MDVASGQSGKIHASNFSSKIITHSVVPQPANLRLWAPTVDGGKHLLFSPSVLGRWSHVGCLSYLLLDDL